MFILMPYYITKLYTMSLHRLYTMLLHYTHCAARYGLYKVFGNIVLSYNKRFTIKIHHKQTIAIIFDCALIFNRFKNGVGRLFAVAFTNANRRGRHSVYSVVT